MQSTLHHAPLVGLTRVRLCNTAPAQLENRTNNGTPLPYLLLFRHQATYPGFSQRVVTKVAVPNQGLIPEMVAKGPKPPAGRRS